MAQRRIAQVAVEQTAFHFDRLYSYDAQSVADTIAPGCRVLVPFGKGNRYRQGMVMKVEEVEEPSAHLKAIVSVLDEQPLLNAELLELASFLKERTFCSLFDAVRAMLPTGLCMVVKPLYRPVTVDDDVLSTFSEAERALYKVACTVCQKKAEGADGDTLLRLAGLKSDAVLPDRLVKKGLFTREEDAFRRLGDATCRMARPTFSPEQYDETVARVKCTPKQREVLQLLCMAGTASVKEVCYLAGVTNAVLLALVKKQLVELFEAETLRSPVAMPAVTTRQPIVLNEEQRRAYDALLAHYEQQKAACTLLHGVTGSGKTQVYLSLIDRVLDDGKQALVLVPEISLTPQTMQLFLKRYGKQVALLHSGLSMGERMDEWKRIRRGEASVVVGTRSAVFAPFSDLGLIVIDEEQEHTYKSESSPRYHARDVAKFRCAHNNALLLLASATPSVESYYAAQSGRYSLCTLTGRYGDVPLPTVKTVDMRAEADETSLFSEDLLTELRACFDEGKQAILLLNRRGYQTFVSCRECGQVVRCPSCSIPLTYHRANGRLMCHYCGHTQPAVHHCPECGSDAMRYTGLGTQRIEEQLQECFPEARVLRMDADATASRFSYEERLGDFAAGKYDVLIGTQMVAKGLDFPNVSLVGILSADRSLYEGDFRSYETAFALFTQVVGRAGRRNAGGKAIIQTTVPEHYVIQLAAKQDYESFFAAECDARRMMKYPPFADLCMFGFTGTDEAAVREGAHRFMRLLKETVSREDYAPVPLIALDPVPASIAKVAGKYRYKLLVKAKNNAATRSLIASLITAFSTDTANRTVTLFADMNPLTIL